MELTLAQARRLLADLRSGLLAGEDCFEIEDQEVVGAELHLLDALSYLSLASAAVRRAELALSDSRRSQHADSPGGSG